jgi:hypothetical protein
MVDALRVDPAGWLAEHGLESEPPRVEAPATTSPEIDEVL